MRISPERLVGIAFALAGVVALARAVLMPGPQGPLSEAPESPALVGSVAPVEFASGSFEEYWKGSSPFRVVEGFQLPPPEIPAPALPQVRPLAPPATPSPPWRVLADEGADERWRIGAPVPPLPDSAAIAALAATPVPQVPARRPDRRNERDRERDVVVLTNGRRVEGRLIAVEPVVVIEPADGGAPQRISADRVADILRAWTREEEYRARRQRIAEGDRAAQRELVEFCLTWGMLEEAAEGLRALCRDEPQEAGHVLALGDVLEEMGDWAGALEEYDAAAGRVIRDAKAIHTRIGRLLERMGAYAAAAQAYQEALRRSPALVEARAGLARSRMALGDPDGAMEALGDFARPGAGTPETHSIAARAAVMGAGGGPLGEMLRRARAHVEEAARRGGSDADLLHLTALVAFYEGNERAAEMWMEAARAAGRSAEPWAALGSLCLVAGRWDDAVRLFEAGLVRDPASWACAAGLGMAHAQAGRSDEAGRWLRNAIEAAPQQAYPAYARAAVLRDAEAWDGFLRAIAVAPDWRAIWPDAALYALESGRIEEAEALLADAAGMTGAPPGAAHLYASVCIQARQWADAARALEAARAAGRESPELLYAIGYVEAMRPEREVRDRLRRAADYFFRPAAEAGYEPARAALEAIAEWQATRILLDEAFEGSEVSLREAGWVFQGRLGAEVRFGDGTARIGGAPRDSEWSLLAISLPAERIWKVEATVIVAQGTFEHAGVGLVFQGAGAGPELGVYLGWKPSSGFVRVGSPVRDEDARRDDGLFQPAPLGASPTERFQVRIERVRDPRAPYVRMSVRLDDGQDWRVAAERVAVSTSSWTGEARLVLYARGRPGLPLRVAFDDVRVYEKEER